RLLEDSRIEIEAISGASAGAVNAVALAHGLTVGGREGARQALEKLWNSVAEQAAFTAPPAVVSSSEELVKQAEASPALKGLLFLSRFFSPYQLNPLDINPLRDILASQIDFERLRAECPIALFIAATQVSTGMLRLFRNRELSVQAVLASACLPTLHRAVEIEGEAYWDGGLAANPPIFPLVHRSAARDIVVVMLHPLRDAHMPTGVDEIGQRLTEITFSSTFFAELQALALAKREAERGLFALGSIERRLRRLHVHLIDAQELMSELPALSKLNASPSFISGLYREGRKRTEEWLERNFALLGNRSSFRLSKLLQI